MGDYYKELELPRDADDEAIKKAYRRLAMKTHPDKGGDAEKFKRVSEAFAILSNPEKRALYDKYGKEGLQAGAGGMPPQGAQGGMPGGFHFSTSGGEEFDAEAIFRQFFGQGGFGGGQGGFGGGQRGGAGVFGRGGPGFSGFDMNVDAEQSQRPRKPPAVTRELPVTLNELATGCVKKLRVTRQRQGKSESKVLEIKVKAGWKSGTKITFQGEGDDAGPNSVPSDITFVIAERAHPRFKRVGDDLIVHTRATLKDIVSRRHFELTHPDSSVVAVPFEELQCDQDGRQVVKIAGKGMPVSSEKSAKRRGDLLVIVHFCLPKLSDGQREVVCAALDASVDSMSDE